MIKRFEIFTVLITKISRNIRRIKTEAMQEFGLKSPHVTCLYYLYERKALTVKQLCDICEEDKGAVSRSITELQQKGFVVEEKTGNKKYKNNLVLTEKGSEAAKHIVDRIYSVLKGTSQGLDEKERESFYNSLSVINEKLEQFRA
jgi:DNA-binding MarR family transcriptional regulator